jgi:hypothetical protein
VPELRLTSWAPGAESVDEVEDVSNRYEAASRSEVVLSSSKDAGTGDLRAARRRDGGQDSCGT